MYSYHSPRRPVCSPLLVRSGLNVPRDLDQTFVSRACHLGHARVRRVTEQQRVQYAGCD